MKTFLALSFVVGYIDGILLKVFLKRYYRAQVVLDISLRNECYVKTIPRNQSFDKDFTKVRETSEKCNFMKVILYKPLLELALGLAFTLLYIKYNLCMDLLNLWVVVYFLVAMALFDILFGIIPDVLNFLGFVTGLGFGLIRNNVSHCFIGAIIGFFTMLIIYALSRGGMGGGDVKAAAMIGAFLGKKYILIALMAAFSIGALVGITLVALGKKDIKSAVAFGPYLAIGAFTIMLYGDKIIELFWI